MLCTRVNARQNSFWLRWLRNLYCDYLPAVVLTCSEEQLICLCTVCNGLCPSVTMCRSRPGRRIFRKSEHSCHMSFIISTFFRLTGHIGQLLLIHTCILDVLFILISRSCLFLCLQRDFLNKNYSMHLLFLPFELQRRDNPASESFLL